MISEIEIKTERLTQVLSAENLGGVLLNAQHNFAWATGGKSNGINLSIENGSCYLFILKSGKKFVLSNNIESRRILTEDISIEDFELLEFSWQDEKSSGDFIFELAKKLVEPGEEIASDLVLHREIRSVENLISLCRYELTGAEIERFRNLGKDAGHALGNVLKTINPGDTELEIARKTRSELGRFHIDSVVTLVGADERIERYRHPAPTANTWKKVLLIAVCARREGLIANLSRLACAGPIPAELQRKTEAAGAVFARLLAATETGVSGARLYAAAAEAYAEKGFAEEIDRHHQGGATGYKTRDWVAHPGSAEIVREHQAFAWNPSITGTKAEETALVSSGGVEMLTSTPGFPVITTVVGGKEFYSPDILIL